MVNNGMWVFRLSVGNSKNPKSKSCPHVDVERISGYKQNVPPLYEDKEAAEESKVYDCDDEVKFSLLKKELFEYGRLRQGWGYQFEDRQLDLNKSGKIWIDNYIYLGLRLWGEDISIEHACGRWNLLDRMTKMEIEDIVFIPRIRDKSKFTVATVCKKYFFQPMEDCFGHANVIGVKNIKEYSYKEHFPAKTFNPYQTPINQIKDHHQIFDLVSNFIENSYL